MKINILEDYQELSQAAATILIDRVKKNPKSTLGLATGGTPKGTYQQLITDHHQNGTSYQHVTTFNLDEYLGLAGENPNSYRYFMNAQLFHHIDIKIENTLIPNGVTMNTVEECQRYEQLLEAKGGVDLQLLGIGSNGHIGFNEPGTSFESRTHVVDLASTTIKANARFFPSIEEVPKQAITMGIGTIMKSKEILLLVSGEQKKAAVQRLLSGEVNEEFPASILNQHPNVTILMDKAAAGQGDRHRVLNGSY
ncbi:glucosamine-6-phosphate deaminase [Mesobacillus maritimus]|uniref:Glucosamine-6-phosphate deaminase n=1 Tax=Mesobacillus maritimus TaxID=1643336 RepID=A0ABS7K1T6_9BACI|nr:glucosamine-6-phosphate deaminase [Mesobacillus maritimus]MBY0096135.1 glucosamine-6-phosphate deaminase [Mesobacillus maritimus]